MLLPACCMSSCACSVLQQARCLMWLFCQFPTLCALTAPFLTCVVLLQ